MTDSTLRNNNENQTFFTRPRILLTGLRRSGKTSIQRVIFTKMVPSKTQFLESTPHLTTNQFSCGSFINFQVQELPGQLHVFPSLTTSNSLERTNSHYQPYDDDSTNMIGGGYDMERLLKNCDALVYIIDAQDDYNESLSRLIMIIQLGRSVNRRIRYEVFIHKVDQLSEEVKFQTQRDIYNQVHDHFADSINGAESWTSRSNGSNSISQDILIHFHLTSIFDYSIFEAFSKVIQKLLPQFNYLENLLTHLLSASNIERACLFDIQTKISIATDSSPTDMQNYELCCDMIDLLIHMSEIYGQPIENNLENVNEDEIEEEDGQSQLDFEHDGVSPLNAEQTENHSHGLLIETTDKPASNVFDSMSSSIIKLADGRALYLREINRHLALICILHEKALTRQAIIDYNVKLLKESILNLFRLNQQTSQTSTIS